ncbi:MAG: CheR family methyltransferase [Lentisphaeria bacterium]
MRPHSAPSSVAAPSEWMVRFHAVVEARLGLHYTAARAPQMEAALAAVAVETGLPSAVAVANLFVDGRETPEQLEALVGQLTVGETYFFREMPGFQQAAERIFDNFPAAGPASGRRPVRVWCAGCCTGEEPYSVAIFLARRLGAQAAERVSVMGTDVNPRFLARAVRGIYRKWSFRNTPAWVRDGYFRPLAGERWEIAPEIRRLVTFRQHNLMDPLPPQPGDGFDVIYCRNVLIYFRPETAQVVLGRLRDLLNPGGWLVVGATESAWVSAEGLTAELLPGVLLFRRAPPPDKATGGEPWLPGSPPASPLVAAAPLPEAGGVTAGRPFPLPRPPEPAAAVPEAAVRPAGEAVSSLPVSPAPVRESALAHAWTLADAGQLEAALRLVLQAVEADKLNPDAHLLAGIIYEGLNRAVEAGAAFNRVLYLRPDSPRALLALGASARRRGATAEAGRWLRRLLRRLAERAPDEVVPDCDGLTAGALRDMVQSWLGTEQAT